MGDIGNLPHDLTVEILSLLPVKPLVRFLCVSKSWFSLISSQEFIKAHLEKSRNIDEYDRHRLIFYTRDGSWRYNLKQCPLGGALYSPSTRATGIDHPFGHNPEIQLVGSCNGLLCIKKFDHFFLWNPSINKLKKLPSYGTELMGDGDFSTCGIGYDESINDYIVFEIVSRRGGGNSGKMIRAYFYSLSTNSWRIVILSEYNYLNAAVFLISGKLHWTTGDDRSNVKIVTFDPKDETYGEVEQVEDSGKPGYYWYLQVLGGRLSLFQRLRGRKVQSVIWILKEYGVKESWTRINLSWDFYDCYMCFYFPVFLSKDDEILFLSTRRLALYNPITEGNPTTFLVTADLEDIIGADWYVESLVLLNDHDPVEERVEETVRGVSD